MNTGLFVTQPQISPTGTLTYQLAADVNRINPAFPQILVEVIAVDTGSSATPNVNKSAPVTFTILPTEINDAPLFTIPSTLNATEDPGLVTVNNFLTGLAAGPSSALDEVGQTFSILVTGDTSAYIAQPAINLTTGALTFQTAQDVNSFTGQNLVVTVTITDSGSNVSPNVNSTTKQFTLNIAPVNDVPVFSLPASTATVFEDNEQVTGVSPTQIANFATGIAAARSTALDENGNPVAATMQSVNFTTVSVTNSSLFSTQPTISPTGTLQFVTAPNQNGSSVVVVRLIDSGSGTVPNVNTSADQTFTIVVKPVNDPPEYFMPNANPTGREDQGLVTLPGFLSSLRPGPLSATDENGQTFTITVTANDPSAFSVLPSIAADGTLTYQTAVDVNSVSRDLTITFYLQDNGTAGPLPDNNRTPTATFSITTAAVNDAPQFALPNPNVTVIEDVEQFQGTLLTNIAGFATGPSGAANTVPIPGPATATDESSQSVNFSVVAVSAPELFEVQPSISSTGMLSFKTAANQNGKAIVVVRLVDNGPSSPSPNTNQSAQQTFTITITPVNDAPQFDIPSGLTINEDQGLVTRSGFATNVRRGPVGADDENSQEIRFQVTPVDPTAFETQPSFLPDGTLSFKTALNVNSLNKDLTVLVTLVDNGTSSPAPNQNTSVTRTFSITTNAVNDPPIADQFSIAGTEDQPLTILASNVLLGDVGGPTADELGQSLNITQVERTTSNGGTVTPVFGPDGIVSMTYTPPANLVGSDSFLYVVTDNGTPVRSGTGTISISMLGVNDPPQFVKGADQTVLEDASAQTVSGWATGILAGPPSATDELSQQTVSFQVVSDHPEYFEIQPSVAPDGTLSFKPAKDANGIAVVSVVAKDNGLSIAPNVNVSPAQTFSITIGPVNDAPVFTAGPAVVVNEDSPAYSQGWATNVAAAAGLLTAPPTATDEAGQVVDFIVTADKPNLFSVQPAISSTGVLTFTPSRDAFGIAFVTVTAKDRGPAGTLDRNTSTTQTMTITINAVNDKPVAVADSLVTNENTVLTYSAPGLLSNDTDADLPADAISAVAVTTTSSLGARVVINADGSVTYDPTTVESIQKLTTGQSLIDTFTYKVKDLSGTESDAATVNVVVTGIDDPPIAADDTVTIPVGQNKLLDVLANDSDVDTPIDPRSIVLTAQPTFGTAVVNSTGVISYTPGVGFRGVDTLRYTVADQAGHVSNEAIVTVIVNNAPVAGNDSAYTFKNQAVTIDVLANDSDADGTIDPSTVQITEIPAPSGTAVVQPNGKIVFTPSTNYSGQVQFSYIVRDNVGTASNVAKVNVQVFQSIWRNPTLQLDVSADGFVSPIDALLVINYINAGRPSDLPGSGIVPAPYYDTNGDEKVTPIDALLVINYLNTGVSGEGEGDGSATSSMFAPAIVTMVTPEQMLATVGNAVVRDLQAELDSVLHSAPETACAPWSAAVTVAPISDRAIASLAEGEGEAADLTDLIAGRNRGLRRGELDDFFGSF
ncbi:MAG: Ig-like domain-containing protein [Pirellulales bacterium]